MKMRSTFGRNNSISNIFRFNGHYLNFLVLLFIAFCLPLIAHAQEKMPEDVVPPPLSILSKGEQERLDGEPDFKKRTDLALELMNVRLSKAENLSSKKEFKESLDELGGFRAIMGNALKFLKRNNTGEKKVLNNFKRLEIGLRQFVPRLEIIRREMPVRFNYHVGQLMRAVRQTRSNAVEPFFDDTVLPDNDN